MSTESLLWVPVIAMLLFTVMYMCFFFFYLYACVQAELSWYLLIFYFFILFYFFFRITFEVLLTSLSRAGMGLS